MCKLIDGDSDVSMLMFKERQKKAAEDFGGIENEETDDMQWALKLEKNENTGAYEKTLNNIILIIENDFAFKR